MTIRLADYFRRPLRLTPAEGLALLAAGRALLAVPGSDPEGPLATALGEARSARSTSRTSSSTSARPMHLDAVRDAVAHHERLEIDYWSAGRDELTTRRVDPGVVFFALGAWYVGGFCHRADDERMFRVDRIRGLRATGEHFEPEPTGFESGEVYSPAPSDPKVTLRLAPTAAWVPEAYPTQSVTERPDGTLDVALDRERAGLARPVAPPPRPRGRGHRPACAPRRRGRGRAPGTRPLYRRARGRLRRSRPTIGYERFGTRVRGCPE